MTKEEKLEAIRHSICHLMSMAVEKIYPGVGLGFGPPIENGFYQDYGLLPAPLTPDILPRLEKEIKKMIKKNIKFEQHDVSFAEALKFYKHDHYKTEMIKDLKKAGEKKVSFYRSDWFENLCKGPHVKSTKEIDPEAFKLTRIAGAYWKGDEKNEMLTRIYGVAFTSKKELDNYLNMMAEAEKRDHRKLGRELDLFCFSNLVGPGLPMFTPKGTIIIDELKKHIETVCARYGFQKVMTPHLAKIDLFKTSGHAQKFADELFKVKSHHKQDYVLKPVQCPHQTQIYASRPRSYRDLPLRYMESEKQYRDEKPGEISGLARVIAITVEDGHTFCTLDQVKEEIKILIKIIRDFYSALGMWNDHWVSLSVRDYAHPEKYIGEPADWDKCEKILAEVAREMKLGAKKREGEAALYGPKLDFMFKDASGREIQIPTVQLDFATPKRFGLVYTDKDGRDATPVMVHRAILGSYERFLVLLIEHFAGAFPLWLSPVQVKIVSVGEKHIKYCQQLGREMADSGIRVEVETGDETVGNKIRKAIEERSPYILVIGDREIKSGKLAVRERGREKVKEFEKDKFIEEIYERIHQKK